jgi:hypothetical protein
VYRLRPQPNILEQPLTQIITFRIAELERCVEDPQLRYPTLPIPAVRWTWGSFPGL